MQARHWAQKSDSKGNSMQPQLEEGQSLGGGSPKSRWKLNANKEFPFLHTMSWVCTDKYPKDCPGSFQNEKENRSTERSLVKSCFLHIPDQVQSNPSKYHFLGRTRWHHNNSSGDGSFIYESTCTMHLLYTRHSAKCWVRIQRWMNQGFTQATWWFSMIEPKATDGNTRSGIYYFALKFIHFCQNTFCA